MLNKELIKKLNMKDPAVWIATWGGCGFMVPAPGTWGSLGGLCIGGLVLAISGWKTLIILAALLFFVGKWSASRFEAMTGTHDSGVIVVDEVVGVWIALLPAALNPISVILAFVLFRFFDILKPWPVSWCDKKLPGALGVMADDVVAGIMAAACLWGLRTYAGIG